MKDIVCRKATDTDLLSIVELWVEMMNFHQASLPFPLVESANVQHEEFVKQRLDKDDCLVVVAELNREVVGYCRATVAHYPPVFEQQPYGMIAELIVAQAHRRQGIGEQLYMKTTQWFQSQAIKRIELATASSNSVSNAFWKKMGFETFREIKQCSL